MNYFKIYVNIIRNAKKENRSRENGYFEAHHVRPECMGGKNTVLLTGREHFIVHLLLTKIYPNNNDLIYAFNTMFRESNNQERYMPISLWYGYKRKLFSENHPMKNNEYLNKMKDSLRKRKENMCDFRTCRNCKELTYSNRDYCSDECQDTYFEKHTKKTKCLVCGCWSGGKYCCSVECFNIYNKFENNEYSNSLSESRKDYIKNNPDKVKESHKLTIEKTDQVERGKKISESKKGKKLGVRAGNAIIVQFFNDLDEYMFESFGNFKDVCCEYGLSEKQFKTSYSNNGSKIKRGKHAGWYCLKINQN